MTSFLLRRPDQVELETIAHNVCIRVIRWLRRKGLLLDESDEGVSYESGGHSALEACLEGSLGLGIGQLTRLRRSKVSDEESLPRAAKSTRRSGTAQGFNIHAGVVVSESDRQGRERLLRYCARPPLRLQRLERLPDGRVAYAIRKPWGKSTHRVMTPLQFLAHLAAVIRPLRHPLVRFFGVFAPHSSWRKHVVPQP